MVIRQNEREVVLQCDGGGDASVGCENVFYADTPDVAEARLMADADGWAEGVDDKDQVSDYCPKCNPV